MKKKKLLGINFLCGAVSILAFLVLWNIAVQVHPPSALSISLPTNTSSLRQLRARISSKENPEPAATPFISSR